MRIARPGPVAAVLLSLVAASCTGAPMGRPGSPGPRIEAPPSYRGSSAACGLSRNQLIRIRNGYRAGRSGDVHFVPRSPNYFGEHSHSGPWPYLQRVPLLYYGPGQVPAHGRVRRPVSLADVAPTLAHFLDFRLGRTDGTALAEAVGSGEPPRLIVTVVWDGAGRNVLREHPDSWPTLRRLIPGGVWFDRATVGSSPSVSPAIHATLGTGLTPAKHGLVDMVFRRHGRLVAVQDDPGALRAPTLGDAYDRENGNRPIVALVGHPLIVGMLGHGSAIQGADRDLAMVESADGWTPPLGGAELFRFPSHPGDHSVLRRSLRHLDLSDGRPDGAWRGEPLDHVDPSATPAFAPFQTHTIAQVVRREGMGEDRVPDLLFLNYNQVNEIGHHWSMNSVQMAEAVRSSDRALGDLVDLLDREVGPGRWVLALTADHGSTPDTSVSGAFVIDQGELVRDLRVAFDRDGDEDSAIEGLRVTQLWLDRRELAEGGFTASDVAWFLKRYTQAENRSDLQRPPLPRRSEGVFAAAIPSTALYGPIACGSQDPVGK